MKSWNKTFISLEAHQLFARDAIVAFAMMFARLSVCLYDCLGRACIVIMLCPLTNGSNGSDLEWPWRLFTGCKPFQMQYVEH